MKGFETMKIKSIMAVLTALFIAVLSGCMHNDYRITFINLTGVDISAIYIAPETDKGNFKNYLKEDLTAGDEIEISVDVSGQEAEKGFTVEAFSAEDNSSETFDMLMVKNGGTVSFYIDNYGLAVGVDMTEEEIENQKRIDNELSTDKEN